MKSIVEEASSVVKAIEKGWIQAGKPCEFTVKVYEEGVKNFFGMSVEPAKIGIFFEDRAFKQTAPAKQAPHKGAHQQPSAPAKKNHQQPAQQPAPQRHKEKQLAAQQPEQRKQAPVQQHAAAPKQRSVMQSERQEQQEQSVQTPKVLWNDELVRACQEWLGTTLAVMGKSSCTFGIEPKKYHLIITFNQPVLEDKERERALFRSFAHVLMQSLRNKFKKGLRGFRIVLNSTQG